MKRKQKLLISIIIVVIVFFAGLYVGVRVMLHFAFDSRKENMESYMETIVEYVEGGQEELIETLWAFGRVLIYDDSGELTGNYYPSETNDNEESYISCEKYIDSVKQGEKIYRTIIRPGEYDQLIDIYFIIGTTAERDGEVIGTVFVTGRQMYFSNSLIVFAVYFTIFYLIVAVAALIMMNKKYELDEMKQTYVANVTHSLKTPVASIKALAETLYDGVEPDTQAQRQYLKMILQQTDNESEMIQNILDLSKIQEVRGKLEKKSVPADETFAAVIEKYAVICSSKGVEFTVTDGFRNLPELRTDQKAAALILDSIMNNAAKFTDEGGKVTLDAHTEKKRAVIIVSDTGVGISAKTLPKIFERFSRGNNAPGVSGSGLGLAIAKEYCSSLNEKIWVKSKEGEGTQIFFTMRLS